MNNLQIIGHGGFAKEVAAWASKVYMIDFFVEDEYACRGALPLSKIDPKIPAVISIGDPNTRRRIAESLPDQKWDTLVHPSVTLLDRDVRAMRGCIICEGSILTQDIVINEHSIINLNCTIGHNCRIGAYNTLSPAVNMSGNVTTNNNVYIGTNASIKEGVIITGNVTIGMGATVIGDIKEAGTYVGLVKTKSN
jgi:sugar O-acyltransferase (sialic acid O-acetyltransferase NeuD family)